MPTNTSLTLILTTMAKLSELAPFILSWEGGYCKVPGDRGGATNRGVTIATWRAHGYDKDGDGDIDEDDVRLISVEDGVERVMRPFFWNPWQADAILCQSLANICVDWGWASGVKNAIRRVQRILGVTVDGVVGPNTLAAINHHRSPGLLFEEIKAARIRYVEDICKANPSQLKFLKGWKRRINAISFNELRSNI